MVNGVTTIILTKNECKNIASAILSAKKISERVLVIDSGSKDETVQIAKNLGADVFVHEWTGHANQFNWALDNCAITTAWVFRLDADERITDTLAEEIMHRIDSTTADGFELRWQVYFMNKWIKHGGTHNQYFIRLFRYSKGYVEDRIMDERIVVYGEVERLRGEIIHYDYKGLNEWLYKHVWYSDLELKHYEDAENSEYKNEKKRQWLYYRLAPFIRAHLYFWYRYYFLLGFLDGTPGKIFCFLQAYWYRFLVDAKIYERGLKQ